MRVVMTESAEEFGARAGALLASRVEHNVLATVLDATRSGVWSHPPAFGYVASDGGEVVAAALRTPPRRMIASVMGRAAADALMAAWLEADPDLPGVGAPLDVARRLGRAWEQHTGGRATRVMAEALHTLDRVVDPARPAVGRLRVCTPEDRALVIGWIREFELEAGLVQAPDPEAMIDRRIERGGLYLWEDGAESAGAESADAESAGAAVSLVGHSPPVAGVVRIGPVYTPPARRSRGYASSAVAALSRLALESGARQCALYTDLANPTSNRIYAAIGYRRVADWEEFAFTLPALEP